jgi:hypothetical protein
MNLDVEDHPRITTIAPPGKPIARCHCGEKGPGGIFFDSFDDTAKISTGIRFIDIRYGNSYMGITLDILILLASGGSCELDIFTIP